ncbi:MAG: EAL domain-containing protein [Acidiphilium sp.]|nr:EAL domain-containing protein [Acidiphilium sp.]MDD4936241.1 EAL domain-containing protein [Acidiphilium sp.]
MTILSVDANVVDRELKRIEAERQKEVIGLLLRDFEEGASDFLWEADADLNLVRPSARFAEAAGTTQERLRSTSLTDFLNEHRVVRADDDQTDGTAGLLAHLGQFGAFHEARVDLRIGGETRCWSITGKPAFTADGTFAGYRGVGSDVTAHRLAEQKIEYFARHDNLTGLANRMSFDSALEALCADPGCCGGALLCIDLDHFKPVNDRFGHQTGDALLVAAVGRMLGCLREQDRPFRLGGDEFAIVMPATDLATAEAIAAQIVAQLATPFVIEAVSLAIGTCVGIAVVAQAGQNPADVHYAADLALYRAKSEGRGTHRAFATGPDRQSRMRRDIVFALNNALDLDAFYMEYQPIVRLASGRLSAVEALIRWNHPDHGVLRPDFFVPEAEHSGAIIPIGRYVIGAACAFAARLPAEVSVSINLSAVQLHDSTLTATIAATLARYDVAPQRIEFELTETAILEMTPQTIAALDEIKALGCRLGLDDFGSGYSSIATLYYFRFDRLKIDRSLIRDAMDDSRRRTILRNVTRMAREIGIVVTGEGAKTAAHRALLSELGFEDGQGSLFTVPLRDQALLDWLKAWNARPGPSTARRWH